MNEKHEPLCPTCVCYSIFLGGTGTRHSCMALNHTKGGKRVTCADYIRRGGTDGIW